MVPNGQKVDGRTIRQTDRRTEWMDGKMDETKRVSKAILEYSKM